MQQYNIEIFRESDWHFHVDKYHGEAACQFIYNHLRAGKPLPDALLCNNDFIALGAIAAFRDFGIKVPGDISVIGHDDYQTSALVRPRLSTISMPSRELIGNSAFELLLQMMRNRNACSEPMVFEKTFIKGETITNKE